MEQLLLFAILGLGSGALFAGVSLSLVLTYRGSGTVNIAAGAIAMLGAYLFYGMRTGGYFFSPPLYIAGGKGLVVPVWLAVIYTLIACAGLGALIHLLVLRPLRAQSPLAKLVATVGLLILIQAVIILRFGTTGQRAPNVLGGGTVAVFGGVVPANRLVLLAIVVIAAIVLATVYRYSRFGLATRAAQENESEAALSGLSANRISMINTMLAAVVAGGLGIVVAPLTQLDPSTLALAVVPALGAALLAKFTSFLTAAAAGIGMGILQSLVTWAGTLPWFPQAQGLPWPGVTELLYFLVIAAILFWRGQSLPTRGTYIEPRLPAAPAPLRIVRPMVIAGGAALIGFLVLPFDLRQALILTCIGAVACLSIVVLTGLVGQVSLSQYAMAGVAGLVVSKLSTNAGLGFPWSPIMGVACAVALGTLTALPALRVRGVQLAILTLAAAVAINTFGFQNPTWGAKASGSPVAEPTLFGIDIGPRAPFPINGSTEPSPVFGFVCLAALLLIAALVAGIRRSGFGKRMLAVRSNERAAASSGVSPRAIKMTTFAVSAFIIGCAGVLYAYNFSGVDVSRFSISNSLGLIAFAYLGGITTIRGAVTGGLMITQGLLSFILSHYLGISITYQTLVAGVLLIFTIIQNPDGIAMAPTPKWPGKLRRRLTGTRDSKDSPVESIAPTRSTTGATT